jgi:cell division protein FtsN
MHSNKQDQNIAALAGILKGQTGSMKKIVAALSQLDKKVKQGVTKPGTNGRTKKDWQRTKNMPQPTWLTDAPSDPSEVEEFN